MFVARLVDLGHILCFHSPHSCDPFPVLPNELMCLQHGENQPSWLGCVLFSCFICGLFGVFFMFFAQLCCLPKAVKIGVLQQLLTGLPLRRVHPKAALSKDGGSHKTLVTGVCTIPSAPHSQRAFPQVHVNNFFNGF